MMKGVKILVLAGLVLSICACNNTAETNQQKTVAKNDADTTSIVKADAVSTDTLPPSKPEVQSEAEVVYADSIDFKKFAVADEKDFRKAPIDWADYPEAKDFKTRITEAYQRDEIDFAGHYILSTFGCGASCIMGFMIDVRDGKIYDLPLGEENSCLFAEDRVVCRNTSKLFIAGICKKSMEDKEVYYKSYLWDEDKKEFKPIEEKEFLKK